MSKTKKEKKIFVLDTSVIIYEHNSILNFDEHDVGIPITVLEELDNFKKGNDTKNFSAREFIRYIDKMSKETLQNWTHINGPTRGMFKIEMNSSSKVNAEKIFDDRKADHRILNIALYTAENNPGRKVVLVTKDVNLRIKAKSLSLLSEDYETGKIKSVDELYTGNTENVKASSEQITSIYNKGSCSAKTVLKSGGMPNHYYVLKNGSQSVLARYRKEDETLQRVIKTS